MDSQPVFEKESIWKLMLRMCVPAVIIMVVMVIYNMTDMYFVGKLNDLRQMAAVSLASPMTGLQTTLGTLIGGGGCAVIARALGERNEKQQNAALGMSVMLSLASGVVCMLLILFGMDLFFPLLGVTAETEPFTRSYLRIMAIGSPAVVFTSAFANIIRAEGAAKESMVANTLGTLTNMLLDPLFILLFRWGVTGAAVATVIGNLVSGVYLLHYLVKGKGSLSIRPRVLLPAMKACPAALFSVLSLGLPSAAGNLLMNFTHGIQNRFLTGYGTSAVAAFSVAGKSTMVIAMVAMGICIGIQPVLGYFYGAGNRAKLRETIRKCGMTAVLVCALLMGACALCGENLVRLFVTDPETVALALRVVRIGILSAPLLGVYYLCSNLLQASGNAVSATVASVLRQGMVLVPVLYLLHLLFGFEGLIWAGVVSDVLSAAITLLLAAVQLRRGTVTKNAVQKKVAVG